MKNLLKNKIFLGGAAGVLVIAIVLTVVLTGGGGSPPVIDNPAEPEESKPPITVEVPKNTPTDQTESEGEDTEGDPLLLEVGGNPTPDGGNGASGGGNNDPNVQVAQPVEPKNPTPPPNNGGNNGGGGIVIIGNGEADDMPYSCGVAGHKCPTPEAHAHISNLELEGCKFCGSKSCPSFYALDQWGKTIYTPSKCPKYDIKNDPVHYCQDCGKKTGDGKNNTCAQFVLAANCPECNKRVPSWTCHTC